MAAPAAAAAAAPTVVAAAATPTAAGHVADAAVAVVVRVLSPFARPGSVARHHDVAFTVEISLLRRLRLGS